MPRTLPCASSAICAAAFRGLRYPGVREVEHEGAERLRPEDARRMGDEAETIFPTRERLSLLQYQLPADRDDHRKHHERQRWKPDPQTEAMPTPWVHGYHLDNQGNWEDISNTIPVAFMGSAGAMISDMNDIRRWIELYATGKTCGAGTYNDLINCIPFLGNTSFGLGITCSEGWYGYTGALPGYNTADYYSPETGITIVAWINYQAKEPVEGVASVMVRDIARILTPDHIPFVYKEGSTSKP